MNRSSAFSTTKIEKIEKCWTNKSFSFTKSNRFRRWCKSNRSFHRFLLHVDRSVVTVFFEWLSFVDWRCCSYWNERQKRRFRKTMEKKKKKYQQMFERYNSINWCIRVRVCEIFSRRFVFNKWFAQQRRHVLL